MAEPHSASAIPSSSAANAEASQADENAGASENLPRESRRVSITFGRTNLRMAGDSALVRDEKWSCLAVIFSFWFFGQQIFLSVQSLCLYIIYYAAFISTMRY